MASARHTYNPQLRLRVLSGCGLILLLIATIRLIDLQIIRHNHFANVAEAQRRRAAELQPKRGIIYLQEGRSGDLFPVASNHKAWISYAVPRDMDDPERIAEEMAPQLAAFRERQRLRAESTIAQTGQLSRSSRPEEESEGKDIITEEERVRSALEELTHKFTKENDPYEPFLRPYEVLDEEFYGFLAEKEYKGIVLEEQQVRVYPEEELAAHVIGYVGFNEEGLVGRYGVEGFFENKLAGDLGWMSAERDASGRMINVLRDEFRPAADGSDIVLTIDRVVQSFIERELRDGVERYGAERGSIIVMNPATGEVLGMATYPTFDPNRYYAIREARVQSNPVVSDIFEPGSILKPVIMAAAIDKDIVAPSTTFNDTGPVRVANYTINTYDRQHHGIQTMTQVIEKSNNVGMVWVGQQMGAQMMYDYLRRFGLGERTGIELEGETQTNLHEPHNWNVTTIATASFGQGIAMTPLQALNAINAIANEGKLMQPYIVSRIRSSDGSQQEASPVTVRQVIAKETADKVAGMMVSVIENGSAALAQVPGYYLAGKTGTAQVADETGRYSKEDKIISFAGFGPIEDPKFSILIKLDNPAGLSFASGTAAPMFRNISEKLLNYYQIPPSYDPSEARPAFRVE